MSGCRCSVLTTVYDRPERVLRNVLHQLRRNDLTGTEIVLVPTAVEGKAFRVWKIWEDPNHYPDDNYMVEDSNSVLYLTMDQDYAVDAVFKCGAGQMLPPVGVVLLVLALGLVIRRVS